MKLGQGSVRASLQSCPTLCDPMDSSPSGSSVHRFLQAKNTLVHCHVLLQGNLPELRIEPTSAMSPELAGKFFTIRATCEALG